VKRLVGGWLIVLFFVRPPFAQEQKPEGFGLQRDRILAAAGDYCETLKNMALNFVCREKIEEKTYEFSRGLIFRPSKERRRGLSPLPDLRRTRTVKASFVYDYQLIKKGGVLRERRDLLEENGKKKNLQDVDLRSGRMSGTYIVFGPVGFLSRSWQPRFEYEILGTETLGPTKAVVLRARPREFTAENYCFGRIWLDAAGADILQIEWEPESILNFQETVDSPIGELKRKITWTVRYDVVKSGLRFPSLQTVKEYLATPAGKDHLKYEATYVYDRYRFFTVETEVVVK